MTAETGTQHAADSSAWLDAQFAPLLPRLNLDDPQARFAALVCLKTGLNIAYIQAKHLEGVGNIRDAATDQRFEALKEYVDTVGRSLAQSVQQLLDRVNALEEALRPIPPVG